MKELIEYKNQQLSIYEIAELEGIPKTSLLRHYRKLGDVEKAVEYCKNNLLEDLITKIDYHGEQLAIKTIAKREGINKDRLKIEYEKSGDIYKAVEIMKERQKAYNERLIKIDYNGEILSLQAIAEKEGLSTASLTIMYKRTSDIFEAVKICKENQMKKAESTSHIEYNGETLSIHAIAKKAGVYDSTLSNVYKKEGDIYKAVFICQSMQAEHRKRKQKTNTTKFGEISNYDLSVVLGIEYSEVKKLLSKGYTPEQIANMNLKPTIHKNMSGKTAIVLPNGQSLRDYCVEHSLNYACIYRAMTTYGKSLADAEANYNNNGQGYPAKWIYDKYGVLLKHLLLKNKINIDIVVDYMRRDIISLEDAVKKYIIRKNSKTDGLYDEWMEELYDVLTDESIKDEYDDYRKTFYVTDKEEACIKKCFEEVKKFNREQLLFEIAGALRDGTFTPEEEPELLKMYEITPEEIDIIFLELYDRFEEPGVLMGKNMMKQRTPEEIQNINDKIAKYKQMIQDNEILAKMRAAVGEQVANNQETRTMINNEIKTNAKKENGENDTNDTK